MYSFFGIIANLELGDSSYKNTLLNELIPYQTEDVTNSILITDDWSQYKDEPLSNNPSQHYYAKKSIHIKEKLMEIAFVFTEDKVLSKVYFKLNMATSYTRRSLRKWLNMQFTNRIENIGQIFHENLLIPLTFFFEHLTPIHAAGYIFNGKTTLLAGTGGTGKTTLEMEMCLNKDASFVTDDIGIVDKEGFVYPNYNNPKIYGYNLVGKSNLKKIIFKQKSILNKIHWLLHKNIFGISKVRRKVSPFIMYNNVSTNKMKLANYNILSKNNIDVLEKQPISIENATQMNNVVMATEYYYFFNHLKWHEFNALAHDESPVITLSILEKRWKDNLEYVLKDTTNSLLKIPFTMLHKEFIKQSVAILEE